MFTFKVLFSVFDIHIFCLIKSLQVFVVFFGIVIWLKRLYSTTFVVCTMTNVSALDKNDVVAILSFSCGARNIRLIQSYVRSLGFGVDRIMLRMLYDRRCPIRVTGSQPIRILTTAVFAMQLIVSCNGQALLQATFTKAASIALLFEVCSFFTFDCLNDVVTEER